MMSRGKTCACGCNDLFLCKNQDVYCGNNDMATKRTASEMESKKPRTNDLEEENAVLTRIIIDLQGRLDDLRVQHSEAMQEIVSLREQYALAHQRYTNMRLTMESLINDIGRQLNGAASSMQ